MSAEKFITEDSALSTRKSEDVSVINEDDGTSSLALAESEKAWMLLAAGKTMDMVASWRRRLQAKICLWQRKKGWWSNVASSEEPRVACRVFPSD